MIFPAPNTCGLPEKFTDWRPGQAEALDALLNTEARALALTAPTGSGKSLLAMAIAQILDMRAVYLTSTKGLQDQLTRDFGEMGLVDIRGANSYDCLESGMGGEFEDLAPQRIACDQGPCHIGAKCELQQSGCLYYDALRSASKAKFIVTNYACWIASNRWGGGIGQRDLIILDEAHDAPDCLADQLKTTLFRSEAERDAGLRWLGDEERPSEWRRWATVALGKVTARIKGLEPHSRAEAREKHLLNRLERKLQSLMALTDEDWIVEHGKTKRGEPYVEFGPLDVAPFAEDRLFLGAKKLLFCSATLRPKTLTMLGLDPDSPDCHLHETPSSFPVDRRPVYMIPSVRMNWRVTDEQLVYWASRIDQFLRGRQDRNGIIHTVSYKRQQLLLRFSEFSGTMLAHTSENVRERVARFKRESPPTVLVSPSVTTGYDFPYGEAEFIIVGKVPYPDTRSRIVKARTKRDPEYAPYVAMQTLVQAVGRGMRAADDRCETAIFDDACHQWFMPTYKHLAPRWFLDALTYTGVMPKAPPSLRRTHGRAT